MQLLILINDIFILFIKTTNNIKQKSRLATGFQSEKPNGSDAVSLDKMSDYR